MGKGQHYLTRYYLEGFCDENGMVWTYQKGKSERPYPQKPINAAIENRLYNVEIPGNPKLTEAVEKHLAEKIEDPAAEAFKALREKVFPSSEEKKKLALFFGTLLIRVPSYIRHIGEQFNQELRLHSKVLASNKDNYYKTWKDFDPSIKDDEIEECRLLMLREEAIEVDRGFLLQNMLFFGEIIASFLCGMKWNLIETNSDWHFITSDSLINVFNPHIRPSGFYQAGLGMLGSEVAVPISRNLTLSMINNIGLCENKVLKIEETEEVKEAIKNLNRNMALRANKFVFSSTRSEKIARLLKNNGW